MLTHKPIKTPGKFPTGTASVQSMSEEHQAAINSYLLNEHPIDKLVKKIKYEWNEFPEVADATIRQMLYRYKQKHITVQQAKIVAKITTNEKINELVATVTMLERRLDPALELEKLVQMQIARLEKALLLEKPSKVLFDTVTKNVEVTANLVTRLADLQMELGLLRRVPKKLNVSAVDVSEEERRYMEQATMSNAAAQLVTDTLRSLRNAGAIDAIVVEETSQ